MEKYDVQVEKKSMDVVNANTGEVFQQEVRVVTIKDNSIMIYAQEETLRMSDKKIRKECYGGKVGVLYGTSTYAHSVKHINDLFAAIKQDYPEVTEEDIDVWTIKNTESIRHAGFTMLWIRIPVEDYIKLKNENKIYIL